MPSTTRALARNQPDGPVALLITAQNCESVLGLKWRLARAHATKLGVPLFGVGRKLAIPAQAFVAALERAALVEPPPMPLEEQSDDAQREHFRAQLGLRRVAGGAP